MYIALPWLVMLSSRSGLGVSRRRWASIGDRPGPVCALFGNPGASLREDVDIWSCAGRHLEIALIRLGVFFLKRLLAACAPYSDLVSGSKFL